MSETRFSIFLLSILLSSITLNASEHQEAQTSQTNTELSARPVVDKPSQLDLQMYLELLNEREKVLKKANEALLKEADYSYVKIPVFMAKAALEGYLLGRSLGNAGTTAALETAATNATAKLTTQKVVGWVSKGGLEKMRGLGFNVGIIGISTATNNALMPEYRWQYGIPIYGTAYSAYLWSDRLMNSAQLIEKNGNEILNIRKEKFRVQSLLEKSS